MKLFRDLDASDRFPSGSVVTIGNFDGIHLGHLSLIDQVRSEAQARNLASVVVTFEPLAREYFARGKVPARIYNAVQRLRYLAAQNIDGVWLMRFNAELAALSPDQFVARLQRAIDPKVIIVGSDFRFGRDRAGGNHQLSADGAIEVRPAELVIIDGKPVSSTRIRRCLAAGDLDAAERMLGRPFSMFGRVVAGQRLGRTLGFPTANIRLHRRATPIHGIFAVRVSGAGVSQWPAVASIGSRPTVGGTETLLEVHLFDYAGDLYGRHLETQFVKKLREEEKFESLAAMTVQMHEDARQARELLAA